MYYHFQNHWASCHYRKLQASSHCQNLQASSHFQNHWASCHYRKLQASSHCQKASSHCQNLQASSHCQNLQASSHSQNHWASSHFHIHQALFHSRSTQALFHCRTPFPLAPHRLQQCTVPGSSLMEQSRTSAPRILSSHRHRSSCSCMAGWAPTWTRGCTHRPSLGSHCPISSYKDSSLHPPSYTKFSQSYLENFLPFPFRPFDHQFPSSLF